MLGIDEESGMAIEIDECDVMAILDSAKDLRSLELKRDALNVDIQWAADLYMAAIDKRIVPRQTWKPCAFRAMPRPLKRSAISAPTLFWPTRNKSQKEREQSSLFLSF